MTTIHDSVLFLMPQSREYLFPAFAALQNYLQSFQPKMQAFESVYNIEGDKEYVLRYGLTVAAEELSFFREQLGMELAQEPEPISYPDSIIDLREERIEMFSHNSRRHLADICAIVVGVTNNLVPKMKAVAPRRDMGCWAAIGDCYTGPVEARVRISGEQLAAADDRQYSGVIGVQGWETYLAAVMGLPVIEILPADKRRNFLSKWFNGAYRMVEESYGHLDQQIAQAYTSLRRLICSPVPAGAGALPLQTAHIASSVGGVANPLPVQLQR